MMIKVFVTLVFIAVSFMASTYKIEIKVNENAAYACNPKVDPGCKD